MLVDGRIRVGAGSKSGFVKIITAPDPGGPETYGSYGSGTLHSTNGYRKYEYEQAFITGRVPCGAV